MGFNRIADLPQHLHDELPEKAQELYLAAYNQAWEAETAAASGEIDEQTLAEQADKDAWLRVKEEFVQDENGRWQPHSIDDDIDKNSIRNTA